MNQQDAEALFVRYADAWAQNDPGLIASHWDSEEDAPFYKAEEVLGFFHSLKDMQRYWAHNERFHEVIRLGFSDMSLKALPGGYAIAFTRMRWDIKFAADATMTNGAAFNHAGKSMGGKNHVLALLKETSSGLKFAGWSETPDAPITYMGQLYQWVADPALA